MSADEMDDSMWFDEFWAALPGDLLGEDDSDAAVSAVRLWGEAFRHSLVWRDGDVLRSGDYGRLPLTPQDQLVVRLIEDATETAARAVHAAAADLPGGQP